jgi:hypothetical protein
MTSRAIAPASIATALLLTVACGGSPETPAPAAAPAEAPAAAPAAKSPTSTLTVIEPGEGSSSGHIDYFRWSPVEGADGYRMRLNAVTDGRVIWESPVLTSPEAELPNTIALEPEGYVWQVTALKGETTVAQSAPARFSVTP